MKQQAFNPYLPLSEYIPDGEAHVFGNRVYLFGSHDKERGESYCMLDYVGCNLTNGHMRHGSNGNKKSAEPCMTSDDKERYLTNITDQTLVGYKVFDFSGKQNVRVQYRGSEGTLAVMTEPGRILAVIPLEQAAQWTASPAVRLEAYGKKPLYFQYHGRGTLELLSFTWEET